MEVHCETWHSFQHKEPLQEGLNGVSIMQGTERLVMTPGVAVAVGVGVRAAGSQDKDGAASLQM